MNRMFAKKHGWLLVGALTLVGCNGADVSFNYYDDPPRRTYVQPVVVEEHHHHDPVIVERTVVVPHGHHCNHHCDHYYNGSSYVVVRKGHVHGPGCGHDLVKGRWVVIGKARSPNPEPRPSGKYVEPRGNSRR